MRGAQAAEQVDRAPAFLGAECGDVPFRCIGMVDRNEGRLTAHGQAHVETFEFAIDLLAERVDAFPVCVGIGFRDARRLADARDRHRVLELHLAGIQRAGHGGGRGGLGGGRQRDVSLAREQARCRVETDPARTGQVDLAPGVQIGEVSGGADGPVERFHVRHELDQIAGDETCGKAEASQQLHQQPAGIAARTAAERQRLFRGLHARLEPDQVADVAGDALVQRHQEIRRRR